MPDYVETATEDLEVGTEPVYVSLAPGQRKVVFNAGFSDLLFSHTGPYNEPLVLRTSDRATLTRPAYLWSEHTRAHITTEEPRK